MYVDPTTRQTFVYANQTSCKSQNAIALDPDTEQNYLLTPQSIINDPPELFKTCLMLDVISFMKYIRSSLLSLNRIPSS